MHAGGHVGAVTIIILAAAAAGVCARRRSPNIVLYTILTQKNSFYYMVGFFVRLLQDFVKRPEGPIFGKYHRFRSRRALELRAEFSNYVHNKFFLKYWTNCVLRPMVIVFKTLSP